uniref:DUF2971 domain-containing protein n=1 Tax=Candidatus Kentrum eta TaxID=2126337 RepID=A0A450UJY8_9GAMM|nr:MAG: Protein of unknown function (DUF2971) [Candidatus Kentron sp. H]VFJ92827.1 MAG: Protein of unknown function (DUF2971) [Candidatus Kentron sp. H]VFJ94786.1 MAG: Protein of unknown function (DUF2971) [Candidatus Kentron sp. H]
MHTDWIDEFLGLMTGSTITLDAIERAHQLKDKNLPDKLYKFRAINDYAISNFETDTVWLCSADKYNDPYECATTWSTEELLRQAGKVDFDKISRQAKLEEHLSATEMDTVRASFDPMEQIIRLMVEKNERIPKKAKEKESSVLLDALSSRARETTIPGLNRFVQQGTRICSFSARVDSTVMWGHYADKHTGFAIEYDVTSWPDGEIRRRMLYPVVYRRELFDATKYLLQAIPKKDFNNLYGLIAAIHKSPDWSYENEWRFVLLWDEAFPNRNYPMPKPSAVYVGSRITPENKARLSEIAAKKRIPIYRMDLSTSEFKLVPHEMESTENRE